MKRIGLLMGFFNPIHNGHVALGESLLKQDLVDEIEVIPAKENLNYKDAIKVTPEQRLAMLELALKGKDKFKINTIELKQKRQYYTYETLRELKNSHEELYLIIGSDNLKTFDKWKNCEEILSNYKIIVVARNNDDIEEIINNNPQLKKYRKAFIYAKTKEINVSSTYVRHNIKNTILIRNLINIDVQKYIARNNLYES